MTWELRVGSATGALEASSIGSVACTSTLPISGYALNTFSAGPHTLVLTGLATDSAAWHMECEVVLPEGGPMSTSCDVPRAP